jgi:polyhydroxyalkanoate synthase
MLRRETADDPERMAAALAGLRRYQEAERSPPLQPPPATAGACGASLREYGGDGPPVLFVPSLINPPNILDLSSDRSLLRWLAAEGGVRPFLLDWGSDVEARTGLSVAGHIESILVPIARDLGEHVPLVGYCLGGTMALAAGATLASPVATIAAPWRFSGFPDESRALLGELWRSAEPTVDRLSLLPMEVLQSAFWSLDPARTVAKFETFGRLDPASAEAEAFVTLEDWANDGPPIPGAAARELFEDMFASDVTGRGAWHVCGNPVDPASPTTPSLHLVSTTDRIVPAATAPGHGAMIEVAQGHVGMVIGGGAREAVWRPLAAWLAGASGKA